MVHGDGGKSREILDFLAQLVVDVGCQQPALDAFGEPVDAGVAGFAQHDNILVQLLTDADIGAMVGM